MGDDRLSDDEGRALLRIARSALEAHLAERKPPSSRDLFGAADPEGRLCEKRGVFVTLRADGDLRGCTGYVEGRAPLWQEVRELAVSSAANDRRFEPVVPDELTHIHIDISVLTPPRPIAPAAVEVGRHGLVVRKAGRLGLLLPQVASEWGWEREEFLGRTCEKAGLPRDSWREPDCEIRGFEAQVFEEEA